MLECKYFVSSYMFFMYVKAKLLSYKHFHTCICKLAIPHTFAGIIKAYI